MRNVNVRVGGASPASVGANAPWAHADAGENEVRAHPMESRVRADGAYHGYEDVREPLPHAHARGRGVH